MNIAILGYGVIGKGVANVLKENNPYNIKIKKIFDLPIKAKEIGEIFCDNYLDIINDKEIDVIVEAMGGEELPYKIIKEALEKGKSVVTSNKEVVSNHLKEFLDIARIHKAKFLFEASCGGGIPLIGSLVENSKASEITSIIGILNGTTNYILSRVEEGISFDEALKMAQENGFAEMDPTNDLTGLDMARKISILSDLAYDTYIDPVMVKHKPLSNISVDIINYLNNIGLKVKYCALSKKIDNKIYISVEEVLVPIHHPLANVKDEYNMILINGKTNGLLGFYGKGAGSLPTATAIVSDLVKIIEDSLKIDNKLDNKYEILESVDSSNDYFCVTKNKDTLKNEYTIKNIKESELLKMKDNLIFYGRIID